MDRVRGRKAIFVGLTDSDRVFGRKGNAICLAGAGEHLVVKGFTGIVNEKERTTSLWVKTTDSEGSLIRWGSAGTGRLSGVGDSWRTLILMRVMPVSNPIHKSMTETGIISLWFYQVQPKDWVMSFFM